MKFLNFFFLGLFIFFNGLFGIFMNRKNILLIIVCVELILLGVNFNFLITSYYLDDIVGQIFALFILTVAAAESSIGLAILVVYYRIRGTISIEFVNSLKS
jgi:NADH:ubiquinone oxidoreductase subunit K